MARLLIVEDHPELASLMVAAAESRGHEAQAVHTGEAALALLRPAAFHAAIVDLLLPDMRGSAVLSALREHAIPAVAVSGVYKGERFAREATEVHGARAFFEKPFELLPLLESVEELCGLNRPLPPPPSDEDEEVVVFQDASLLDVDDEPLFSSESEDEPVFSPPSRELPPVVQGLALVEEVQAPMMDEAPAPLPAPTLENPAPAVEEPAPAEEEYALAEEEPASGREEPAPAVEVHAPVVNDAPTEPRQDSPAPHEDPHGEAPVPGVDEPESSQQELVPPAAESADLQEDAPVTVGTEDLEELGVLEELNEAEVTAEQAASASEPAAGLPLPFGEREKVWDQDGARPLPGSLHARVVSSRETWPPRQSPGCSTPTTRPATAVS